MSQLNTIQALFRHFDWAQEKMLAAAGGVPRDDLNREFEIGCGTARRTLLHIHESERVWLDRCTGNPAAALPPADDNTTMTDLRHRATEVAARRKELLASLSESDLQRDVHYTRNGEHRSLRLADIFIHICNHAMHHRAQTVNMLRQLGVKPPLTEYLFMQIEGPSDPQPQLSLAILRDYIGYTDWARDVLVRAAAALSDEQLDRPFEMGMGSIRKTLVHLNDADRWWMENWQSGKGQVFPAPEPGVVLKEIQRRGGEMTEQRNRYLASLSDEALNVPVKAQPSEGQFLTFPLGQTMIEECNHATHHRAHAINMFRQVGVTVPPTDYSMMKLQQAAPAL